MKARYSEEHSIIVSKEAIDKDARVNNRPRSPYVGSGNHASSTGHTFLRANPGRVTSHNDHTSIYTSELSLHRIPGICPFSVLSFLCIYGVCFLRLNSTLSTTVLNWRLLFSSSLLKFTLQPMYHVGDFSFDPFPPIVSIAAHASLDTADDSANGARHRDQE